MKYGKSYDTIEEDERRRGIYEDNMDVVIKANKDFEVGESAFDTDVNKYADMTTEEFVDSQCGLRRNERSIEPGMSMMNLFMPSPMLEDMAEDEIDWRKEGAVTPVKNQGETKTRLNDTSSYHKFILELRRTSVNHHHHGPRRT